MRTVRNILGVTLEVYKQRRQLTPEDDGYLGQLWSGSAVILAVIDPSVDPMIGLFRDGKDNYVLQKDWLNNPTTPSQKQCHELYLAGRSFPEGTKVYGVRMPLRVDTERSINRVHYPENMLMLVQYHCSTKIGRGGFVLIWKIALVSQDGEFFLTVQEAYDVQAHENEQGKLCYPRFAAHKQLERLLVASTPEALPRFSLTSFRQLPGPSADGLAHNEGIVERWYDARNMGCILTTSGPARVHWSEVPGRPRRHFLVAGERVKVASLGAPPPNPRTDWRTVRKPRFQLQACGVECP